MFYDLDVQIPDMCITSVNISVEEKIKIKFKNTWLYYLPCISLDIKKSKTVLNKNSDCN